MRTKPENFRNAPKPNFDLYVISIICTNFEAFTIFSTCNFYTYPLYCRTVRIKAKRFMCQVVKISANLAFDYLSKCEIKENALRGRCQDSRVMFPWLLIIKASAYY